MLLGSRGELGLVLQIRRCMTPRRLLVASVLTYIAKSSALKYKYSRHTLGHDSLVLNLAKSVARAHPCEYKVAVLVRDFQVPPNADKAYDHRISPSDCLIRDAKPFPMVSKTVSLSYSAPFS